jgi:hypothetical protein
LLHPKKAVLLSTLLHEFSYEGWGYTPLQITANTMKITSHGVDAQTSRMIDTTSINLV